MASKYAHSNKAIRSATSFGTIDANVLEVELPWEVKGVSNGLSSALSNCFPRLGSDITLEPIQIITREDNRVDKNDYSKKVEVMKSVPYFMLSAATGAISQMSTLPRLNICASFDKATSLLEV